MNEISDAISRKEKELMNSRAMGGLVKVGVTLVSLSPKALAAALELGMKTTKGLTDFGITSYNKAYAGDKPSDKHRHKAGFKNAYGAIVKSADAKNQTLENVPVSDKKMLGFERIARQYKIQYGIKKIVGSDPPAWNVYFSAKDAKKMSQAFKEFTHQERNNQRETPQEKEARSKPLKAFFKAFGKEKQHNQGGHEL